MGKIAGYALVELSAGTHQSKIKNQKLEESRNNTQETAQVQRIFDEYLRKTVQVLHFIPLSEKDKPLHLSIQKTMRLFGTFGCRIVCCLLIFVKLVVSIFYWNRRR
jgi:hypothetical protein